MTEQQQQPIPDPAPEQVDEFIRMISADHQQSLLSLFMKHNDEANKMKIGFPVIMYFVADAMAAAVYEIVKHSMGEHDVNNPKVLTEAEHEVVKMIKKQINEAWSQRIEFFLNQDVLDNAVKFDGADLVPKPN